MTSLVSVVLSMVVAVIQDGWQNQARVLVGVHTALDSEETYICRWVLLRLT